MDTKFEFDDEKNATLQRVKKLGKVLATDVALIGIRKPKHAHRCVLQMFSDYFVRQFQFFEPKSVYVGKSFAFQFYSKDFSKVAMIRKRKE